MKTQTKVYSDTPQPFAEVIESTLQGWLAQTWQWDQFAEFGSLMAITQKERTLIGIVCQMKTGSMDPMRYPFPYQKSEEELLSEQPQIFEFLKTTFSCLIAGYLEKGKIHYQLAPHPAKIHAFVQPASAEIVRQFFASEQYVHLIIGNAPMVGNVDELLLAMLTQQKKHGLLSDEKLAQFLNTYSLLTGNDYRRIKLFLQRVENLV